MDARAATGTCFSEPVRMAAPPFQQAGRFPARSTYFDQYRRVYGLFERAIRLQGERAADGPPIRLPGQHRRGYRDGQVQWILDGQ